MAALAYQAGLDHSCSCTAQLPQVAQSVPLPRFLPQFLQKLSLALEPTDLLPPSCCLVCYSCVSPSSTQLVWLLSANMANFWKLELHLIYSFNKHDKHL